MPNKKIDMNKVRKVLQLHLNGRSKSFISKYLSLSRNTVKKYIAISKILQIDLETLKSKTDAELNQLFGKEESETLNPKQQALYGFFPYMEKQLRKQDITFTRMWQEYIEKHPDGYQSTQFREYYKRWSNKVNPAMHMVHKAGDKMFVDYAGKTLQVTDMDTGEITEVQFFVAILGASQYTYAEASLSQRKEDFIASVENAIHYFKGVPAAIVPDNLRSAVTKSSKYEPVINETFEDFAQHYDTAVLPARAYCPKDKSLAEGAVKILYRRIYPELRKQTFYSLKDLNQAIWVELEKHNLMKLTGRPYSRMDLFKELEENELKPLPVERYEIKQMAIATVFKNAHVHLKEDKHYYSVPFQYIKKKVKILYTSNRVEIYHQYNRIATHQRNYKPYNYTTVKEHMASNHQFMTEWTPQRFIDWGKSISKEVETFIIELLKSKAHPEQAYKSCIGVLSMGKKVGYDRLTSACKRASEFNIYNYKIIQNILEKNLDQAFDQEDEKQEQKLPEHQNIRGDKYYQ